MDVVKVSFFKVDTCRIPLCVFGGKPCLGKNFSPEETSEWEAGQVHFTKIRPAHIQPGTFSLLLVTALSWLTIILVYGNEPFDVGTAQFHSLKGIDILLDIRSNSTKLQQVLLPLLIDLWLCSPGLALLLPITGPSRSILA